MAGQTIYGVVREDNGEVVCVDVKESIASAIAKSWNESSAIDGLGMKLKCMRGRFVPEGEIINKEVECGNANAKVSGR